MTVYGFSPELVLKALSVAGAFVAMVTDMRWGKIYNWLTFPLIITGWLVHGLVFGWNGLGLSFAATITGIAFYLGFALVGAMGMGDVKLLGAIGALGGVKFVVSTFLYASVLGIVHASFVQFLNYGKDAFGMLLTSVHTRAFMDKTIHDENKKEMYHYYLGIDIFLGSVLAIFFEIPLGL